MEGEKNPSQSGLEKAPGSFKRTVTQSFGRAEEHFSVCKMYIPSHFQEVMLEKIFIQHKYMRKFSSSINL